MKFLHRFQSKNNSSPNFHSKVSALVFIVFCFVIVASTGLTAMAKEIKLRYGHMNAPTSVTGQQAEWLAEPDDRAIYTSGRHELIHGQNHAKYAIREVLLGGITFFESPAIVLITGHVGTGSFNVAAKLYDEVRYYE